ncbi:Ltp family lipoprotein [uncultured Sphingomonas sp.]|uniref:Ltp family lipoprotein n=1 Tax=uncultured Sphingomonas sp. TaxID=158754 RepID=UPI002623FFFE|nr:Ltp family lipoprotein [uncultured Sphingomonas sp.]
MEADEKKCPQCAETIKAEAKVCRFCGHSFEADPSSNRIGSSVPNKQKGRRTGCLIVLGILVALGIIGSLASPDEKTAPSSNAAAIEDVNRNISVASNPSASTDRMPSTIDDSESSPKVGLFGPQANAARSAKQYLGMTGFSRRGLIEQLSSDAGDGYSVADATAAVDSLTVDWNEQAVRSAKQYLDMTGFSCSGLIEQLSSDAGSKYTNAQARYGAKQAGAC